MRERLYVRLGDDAGPGPETSAPAETLLDARVPATLAPYVTSILGYREDLGDDEVVERVLPDGAVRLAFHFGDPPSAGARRTTGHVEAIGATTAPALVRLGGRVDGLTVTLRPGAAAAVLGVPARALTEDVAPLDALWGGESGVLHERLLEAGSDHARVALITSALEARLARARPRDHALAVHAAARLARAGGRLSVRALADTVGTSERRLQQIFAEHVGLSPRAWGRLARLHALVRALRTAPSPRWARLAADTGFYDQAHLANELRSLSGLRPSDFAARASGSSKT